MLPKTKLNAPWTLRFDRDGTEDVAIICDGNGSDLATSRHFWRPEGKDAPSPTLAGMTNTNCLEDIRCPKCHQEDRFFIMGCALFDVTDDGSEAVGDHEWDDESRASCPECGHTGRLKHFYAHPDSDDINAPTETKHDRAE
jgi:hypothetical protein